MWKSIERSINHFTESHKYYYDKDYTDRDNFTPFTLCADDFQQYHSDTGFCDI